MKRIFLAAVVAAAACQAGFARDLDARFAEFRSMTRSPRHVSTPEDLAAALASSGKIYEEWLPADYGNALRLQNKATWTEMTSWYRFASQELLWTAGEARRLNAAYPKCGSSREAAAAAQRTLASAKKLLRFIDTASWGEGLRKPMTGEMRRAQAGAVKDWEKLARRLSGK